jgi:hypothetical protein
MEKILEVAEVLNANQVEAHALEACTCPGSIGPALGAPCCQVCDMQMLCPDCGKCRGCSLVLRINSWGPPRLKKKSRAKRRIYEGEPEWE